MKKYINIKKKKIIFQFLKLQILHSSPKKYLKKSRKSGVLIEGFLLCMQISVSFWSTLHLEARAVPSLDLSFLDQATPHVEPPSRPSTESDVVVVHSTISHLLSLDLLSLSIVQKNAFHAAMVVLQFTSLEPEARAFISRVIHHVPEVFSSIKHMVKENAQVISELEKLREKISEYV